jgi:hypothetical protein
MPEQHTILGGKVHVYKRPNSSLWQCSSYFAGKNRRTSTKEESLSKAKYVVRALAALNAADVKPFRLVSSGGTALSRAHRLIRRMSESGGLLEDAQQRPLYDLSCGL